MNNPFEQFSQETMQGWFARVSSKERWEMDMEDYWERTISNENGCKDCVHFEGEYCEASFADECPQVIAEFNLDEKHFN